MDVYSVSGRPGILHLSAFFVENNDDFLIVAVSVQPGQDEPVRAMIKNAHDKKRAPNGRMYFLGYHPIDASLGLRVLVREERINRRLSGYSIMYIVTDPVTR